MKIEVRNYFNEVLVSLDYPKLDMLSSDQKTYLIGIGNYSDYNVEFTEDGMVIFKQNNIDMHPETIEINYIELMIRIVVL